MNRTVLPKLLNGVPVLLLLALLAIMHARSPGFLAPDNLVNILVQAGGIGIAAVGMALVLIAAGVDLSVGGVMFVSVAVAGKLVLSGHPVWLGFGAGLGVGLAAGLANAFFVIRCKVTPFIATLAMLFIARGFGLWITRNQTMNMPDSVTGLGSATVGSVPAPVLVLAAVAISAHILLTATPFGRQIYAVGSNPETARKAGINVTAILVGVYLLCGLCAALSGWVSLTQAGTVSPRFGLNMELLAIAAALLGGTSLFGGRGTILPGIVIGALLIQSVEAGLVNLNADPYLHPMITSAIIFLAVLLDSLRGRALERLGRRPIRAETD